MKSVRKVFFIIIVIAILTIPVVILANSNLKEEVHTMVMGNKSVSVDKSKSRAELEQEKINKEEEYKKAGKIVSTNSNTTKEKIVTEKIKIGETSEEKQLELIAEKYNKKDLYNKILKEIQEQNPLGNIVPGHVKMCELFMDIVTNEKLTEEEKKPIKKFLEMMTFNDIDKGLEEKINKLLENWDQ